MPTLTHMKCLASAADGKNILYEENGILYEERRSGHDSVRLLKERRRFFSSSLEIRVAESSLLCAYAKPSLPFGRTQEISFFSRDFIDAKRFDLVEQSD
jgi:hypothetical protein